MNYIQKLQKQKETVQDNADKANNALVDFYIYLSSDKFHNDPTIQVADVLRRLDMIREHLNVIRDEVQR
jgi:hypothetical protein